MAAENPSGSSLAQNPEWIDLELPVGAVIYKAGDYYELIEGSTKKLSFPIGTAFKTSPTSTAELLLLKEQSEIEKVSINRGRFTCQIKTGTKLKLAKHNAMVQFNEDQTFELTHHTQVIVPKGTHMSLNGMRFVKHDDTPMYLSCTVQMTSPFMTDPFMTDLSSSLFSAFINRRM